MKVLSDIEVQKAGMMKAARAAIRLKHMLRADAEINEVLPVLEERINAEIASGQPFELTLGTILDDA